MIGKRILEELVETIIKGEEELAIKTTKAAICAGLDPTTIVDDGLLRGMDKMREKYEKFEIFLPEVILAADAMKASMKLLSPLITPEGKRLVKIIISTVTGDIHDIGKDIVASMLSAAGFDVYDLGVDVPVNEIIGKAEEVKADIIALSSLMTQSMYYQKDFIEQLKDTGMRDRYFVIIGGGAVTPEWAEKINADGYGKNHYDAVRLCKNLASKLHHKEGK